MCGISAYARGINYEDNNPVDEATSMLRRLVYRGYDSWGYATGNGYTVKNVGEIPESFEMDEKEAETDICISHTRWATHGQVNEYNAHPHESCEKEEIKNPRYAVVHNGVIENHEELKDNLTETHRWLSNTDTEIIPHFIEEQVEKGRTTREALQTFDREAQGNYAIVLLDRKTGNLYGLKRGNPLVFAIPWSHEEGQARKHPKGAYFASDLYAISDKCEEAYFMEDGDLIMTSGGNYAMWNNGEQYEPPTGDMFQSFEWTEEEPELSEEHHYWMEKEIKEIPEALKRLRNSLTSQDKQKREMHNLSRRITEADQVIFTASGTSYHASLLGVYYLQQQDIDAQALIASEFENFERVTENTLVVAVSQSGETRDVLNAINLAKRKGADIASLVNVPYSTIQRKSDISIEIKAQQENCVAATKTFANQVYTLMHLAYSESNVPKMMEDSISDISWTAHADATQYFEEGVEDIYIIGNASTYPIAREIALKLKEIPYIHAEGMMAGELKHGTLALIEEGTPVIALDDGTGNIETSVEEVEARGANTATLKNDNDDSRHFVFQAAVYGFFLALYWAHFKDLPVDRPRNLAKSVTVK